MNQLIKSVRSAHRASYSYTVEDDKFVCIVDKDKGRSVTNDAENVVADLVAAHIDVQRMCIIYRDSGGIWDRLVTIDGKFSGFEPIRGRSKEEAKLLICKGVRNSRVT